MMKKLILISLLATSSLVYADAKLFEGLAIDVSTGYQQTERDATSNIIVNGTNYAYTISETNENSANAVFGASYSFALSSKYLLGIGFDYDFTDHDIGNPALDMGDAPTISYELSDAMSLYVKPQLMLTEKSQIYAKLAYIRADLNAQDASVDFIGSSSESLDGYSIGAGFASMINDNISLFVEANYFDYGEEDSTFRYVAETSSAPSDIDGYNAKIGIAYIF